MSKLKIFILEDDPSLNETLVEFFEDKGFDVDSEYDGYEAESKLYENRYDLIILDVNVPSLDGFSLLKSIREFGVKTPVIFLTARDGINDLQNGFKAGAEDYIKKPFLLDELYIRVEAILSRYNKNSLKIKLANNITFNRSVGELIIDGKSHKLSNKESRLLEIFIDSKGEILSHEDIFRELWEYDETPSDSSLRTYIKNLRKLLGKDSIESIKKRGYRYIIKE
jgi:DNA-binding response OmpR family regulator